MASRQNSLPELGLALALDIDDVLSTWEETGSVSIFSDDFGDCALGGLSTSTTCGPSNSNLLYQHWDEPFADRLLDLTTVHASMTAPHPVMVPNIDITPLLMQQEWASNSSPQPAGAITHGLLQPASDFFSAGHKPTGHGYPTPSLQGSTSMAASAMPPPHLILPPAQQQPQQAWSEPGMHMGSMAGRCNMVPLPQQPLQPGAMSSHNAWSRDLRGADQYALAQFAGPVVNLPEMRPSASFGGASNMQRLPAGPQHLHQPNTSPFAAASEGHMSNEQLPFMLPLQKLQSEVPKQCCSSSTSNDAEPCSLLRGKSPWQAENRCSPVITSNMCQPMGSTSSLHGMHAADAHSKPPALNLSVPDGRQCGVGLCSPRAGGYASQGGSPLKSHCSGLTRIDSPAPLGSPAGTTAHQLASRLSLQQCSSGGLAPAHVNPALQQFQQGHMLPQQQSNHHASPAVSADTNNASATMPAACARPAPECLGTATSTVDIALQQQQQMSVEPMPSGITPMGSMMAPRVNSPMQHANFSHMPGDWVRTRSQALERYRDKRARRAYTKKIRYQLRKINADRRPRIKGRFVRKDEMHLYAHLFAPNAGAGGGAAAKQHSDEGELEVIEEEACSSHAMYEGQGQAMEDDAGFGGLVCGFGAAGFAGSAADLKLDIESMLA